MAVALTPQDHAAARCRKVAMALAALELPEPTAQGREAIRQHRMRNFARQHLAAMASLNEPDLAEPSPFDGEAYSAWRIQQRLRFRARYYLADVALAGDLLREAT